MGVHPRPPEPHSGQGIGEKRQIVGFDGLPSVGNDILPYPMPYFAGVYGDCYGNRLTYPFGRINSWNGG